MKQSLRAHRMERYHKRSKMQAKLSLVSLMDIFTILVFFLLVNSSDVEILQSHKSVQLPESTAEQKPENNLMIMVNSDSILVNGRKIADTGEVMLSDRAEIDALRAELDYRAGRQMSEADPVMGRKITIMGSRDLPYSLLKKIMMTCAQTEYRNISLAVNRVVAEAPTVSTLSATTSTTTGKTAVEG